ncbi:MAG: HNH endonuclease [Chthoniobacterales bacterium]
MARNTDWTHDQHVLAFHLYCQIPFGKIHQGNPRIIELASLIGRTPSAVGFKLSNFARLDPVHQARGVTGLTHGAHGEEDVWKEFNGNWERLAQLAATLIAQLKAEPLEATVPLMPWEKKLTGKEREALVMIRVNQRFFRSSVLAVFDYRCCITGLTEVELLTASHIIPWSVDTQNRVNPQNGLCLNTLHDRAFDRGLLTVTPEMKVKISPILLRKEKDAAIEHHFTPYEGIIIPTPPHFAPASEFLSYHNKHIFRNDN